MSGDTPVISITNGAMRWLTRRREQHAGILPQLEKRNATTPVESGYFASFIYGRSHPQRERIGQLATPVLRLATLGTLTLSKYQEVQDANAATGGIHRHSNTHTQRSRICRDRRPRPGKPRVGRAFR